MAGENEFEELAEVEVSGRNRNPNAATRVRRARETFAPGTFLPRVQALLNPRLFRERADTNNLLEDVFAEDGPLGRLAATNPELVNELRQQAANPMQSGEHKQFRSALLGLVGQEVEKEGKIRAQVADNEGFMRAFAALDSSIPGIRDPDRFTLEESERRQIGILFDQAQQLALLDPDASKAIMAEVRKKADTLTANVRQFMEKNRRDAQLQDAALWSTAQERINETNDIIASLRDDMDERGVLRDPHPALIGRAMAALGRSSDLPGSGINEAAEAVGGVIAAGTQGSDNGNILATAISLGGQAVDKLKQRKEVGYLIQRLEFNRGLIEKGYLDDRQKLAERFRGSGIELGQAPGEAYAVVDEAYQAEADKIPAKAGRDGQERDDQVSSLRTMLDDELRSADAAVEKLRPDAAANLPGAAERLASAMLRQQIATDDLAIFEDDLRQAAGKDLASVQGVDANEAQKALQLARARRKNRSDATTRASIRRATMEALRSHTR